ncbi:PREDICTED: pentatricopeptide repeat-containing protein At3g62470, mitochondrial-like [Erythranthe guttata]|uniref:pentatricopeptide repeat-containing protein At3g62470, mitochondrial-like n=1 Tax=Erythranthe guttata TaxID=4155 RepID=UPI00064DCA29|nr:PREDICTED: pentatricopeptide repeat-containing protein At3g62470, mitochondrial-like [Erythranthe guttata]|eukprot:XP_012840511.1 PREDICTED: pentatricopeptide repeat-containing protein At3g62470, mitochondrial-like [Erythranthe guttata]
MAFHLRNSRKSPLSASTQVHKFLAGDGGRPSLFAAGLHSPVHGQDTPLRGRGVQREKFDGSSLPMYFLLNSFTRSSINRTRCQIPFVLPYPSSLSLKKCLPAIIPHQNPPLCLNKIRPFCSDVNSVHTDSEFESDIENESASAEFEANLKEVETVCKRFNHARKPAFRFFRWAGDRPGFSHDSTTYNAMMNILGKTRQFQTLVSLLDEMGEKGFLTMETFTMCIKVFAAAKERKKAVAIVDLMKKYNFKVGIETVNCLLDALGRAKLAKEAQTLFEKLEHKFAPNLKTYTILINGWCTVKNLMEAARMWNEMIDKGFKPDIVAHNIMLEGLLRSHTRSDAIKLFEVMKCKGPLPTVRSYSVLIKNLCKHGHLKEAIDYFDEMVDSGCGPDAAVYTCLMTGFANQKNMDIVYGLLNEMKEKNCQPDGRLYNALIKMMVNRRMPDEAVKIY